MPQPKRCVRWMMMETMLVFPDAAGLARASAVLRAGGLVAFPTETVYGLGGDACNNLAVAQIFAAKGRPQFNPLIVHVADMEMAEQFAHFDAPARGLAAAFWPGPLTLVLRARAGSGLSPLATAGLDSVAIRIPAHPAAQALLRAFGGALAAPSANPSGRISPTRAEHVAAGLSGRIAAILDGGPCAVGVESTILALLGTPELLRAGGVTVEALEAHLQRPLAQSGSAKSPNLAPNFAPTAPGQLESHYAPNAALRLNAAAAQSGEVMIGFGPVAGSITLSATGDMIEAAANLFHMLRAADDLAGQGGKIAVAPIPNTGLGLAINDRLTRAAAPRS